MTEDFYCFWAMRSALKGPPCPTQCSVCAERKSQLERFEAAKQVQLTLFPRGQW